MNREKIIAAAEGTLVVARQHGMDTHGYDEPSVGYDHLVDMLEQMRDPEFSMGKLNRWLGWMQASVVAYGGGDISLDAMKNLNRP